MGDTASRRAEHWDDVHRQHGRSEVSWYEAEPSVSLAVFDALGVTPYQAVIDVGGGESVLAARLVGPGFRDATVLDLSATALERAQEALSRADPVHWLEQDVLAWQPDRRYEVWHDRAEFHFLVDDAEREAYLARLRRALAADARVVIATFAADGPDRCSGLPVRRYSLEDLAGVLGEEFEVVAHRRDEHHTPTGARQPFTWPASGTAPPGDTNRAALTHDLHRSDPDCTLGSRAL